MNTINKIIYSLISIFFALPVFATTPELPELHANINAVSVSGLSSGGAMAVQYGVAFSKQVMGVGVFAGVPYYCAQNNLSIALTTCMSGKPNSVSLENITKAAEINGYIDSTSNLNKQHVWLYSGTKDQTVKQTVMNSTYNYYTFFMPKKNIDYVDNIPSGHAFITDNFGNSCGQTKSPFINNCDYDSAGKLLSWIYGPLNPKAGKLTGQLRVFSQTPFISNDAGMAQTGFLYIPKSCVNAKCKLHVVFHGCKQNESTLGDTIPTKTQYDAWADTNNIIILYPQTSNQSTNPNGCWDWWGYTGTHYAYKDGLQMSAINKMIKRLTL